MVELLVSVRTPQEALVALGGGANWIDVKEPANGPLGMATPETLEKISSVLPPGVPSSAALGEAKDSVKFISSLITALEKYELIKLGLSYISSEILDDLLDKDTFLSGSRAKIVLAAYADHSCIRGIAPWDALQFCLQKGIQGLLIDTFQKGGKRLFDWVSMEELLDISRACQENNIRFGLAGSLQLLDLERLLSISPSLVGIRGAACRDNNRVGEICPEKVQKWKSNLIGISSN